MFCIQISSKHSSRIPGENFATAIYRQTIVRSNFELSCSGKWRQAAAVPNCNECLWEKEEGASGSGWIWAKASRRDNFDGKKKKENLRSGKSLHWMENLARLCRNEERNALKFATFWRKTEKTDNCFMTFLTRSNGPLNLVVINAQKKR